MAYRIVLEDDLLQEWYAFKHGKAHDKQCIEKLLHYYKPNHLTNVAQLGRMNVDDSALISQLASNQLISQSLEDLAQQTTYKIILSQHCSDFPRVNIHGDALGNNYVLSFQPGESRAKAHTHLQALLQEAQHIVIYDRYLKDAWGKAKNLFALFPRKKLTIELPKLDSPRLQLDKIHLSELKSMHQEGWTVKTTATYPNHHDRYILIDNQLEIVITSGIDYLFDASKECTLIIRERKPYAR
ncbi:hypothetical protein [Chrysiogenes arsenatis]|uniref:hypothetical protein n=1 Tax=Chrysiogenes arsenatis TaxID=309797 RepID=UPI00040289A6|nr:hypothetical protein [Chrysiogenes arsenatis]